MSALQGVLGPIAFKMDSNVRVVRGACMVKSVTNSSTQQNQYAALPAAANGVFIGAAAEDLFEPGYFYTAGTDPTTVTGTTPGGNYNLQGRPIALVRKGVFPLIASGVINQGDFVKIADIYGRVQSVGGEAAGTLVNVVGQAMHATAAANDLVYVDVAPCQYTHN